jgi:putative addiction module component (TIGR02574 family)
MSQSPFIIEVAERLPPLERIKLVEHLLDTLDKPDPGLDAIWADECELRLDTYLRGDAKAIAAADVLSRHIKP